MKALMDVTLEEVSACLKVMEAFLGKMDPMMKAGQEQVRAEVKTGMEEMEGHRIEGQSRKDRGFSEAL
jgi:hypothetical protein